MSRNNATHVVSDIECIADKVVMIKNGEILNVDTPINLIKCMDGKVAEITGSIQDIQELKSEYHVGNLKLQNNGLKIRIAGDKLPPNATIVTNNINLEDVFLYYFE